jgi:hypothetical protein
MSNANPQPEQGSPTTDIEAGNDRQGEKDDKPQSLEEDIVDWDSPIDPENPRNWPKWKKKMHIFLLGILTLNA